MSSKLRETQERQMQQPQDKPAAELGTEQEPPASGTEQQPGVEHYGPSTAEAKDGPAKATGPPSKKIHEAIDKATDKLATDLINGDKGLITIGLLISGLAAGMTENQQTEFCILRDISESLKGIDNTLKVIGTSLTLTGTTVAQIRDATMEISRIE
jgi:hypothetical protein